MRRSKLDRTITSFVQNVVRVLAYAVILVIVLTLLGIPMNSIIAVIASAGLAIGLAMQSSLSNVASSLVILYSKLFKAGDFVDIGGNAGTVDSIGLFTTKLVMVDNRVMYIPNTTVASEVVINHTTQDKRRLEWTFSVPYRSDVKKALEIISDILKSDKRVFADGIFVRITSLGETSRIVTARAFTSTDEYWNVNADILEKISDSFDENNISLIAETAVRQVSGEI